MLISRRTYLQTTTAAQDSEVVLSSSKAKELGVAKGDVVVLVGRRRRASFARVNVSKSSKAASCAIRSNMAANLRLRQDDKIKVEVFADSEIEEKNRSGDLMLLQQKVPANIRSATFSPVEDSLTSLVASEGGDDISDEELQERFVAPYMVGDAGLLKQGSLVTLIDDNGKRLEFYITQLELDDDAEEEGEARTESERIGECPNNCRRIHTVLTAESDEEEPTVAGVLSPSSEFAIGAATPRLEVGLGYDSVGGMDKTIKLMRELVEMPLRFPELWSTAGVPTPKGVLLYGPPGCGKTLLANALVEETGAHIVMINGPEIMARKGGESEANLRQAFEEAIEKAPSIIFMDELDSIAPKRDQAQGETEKRVVSQLLTLMDSLKPSSNVMVIGATNRPNVIESALRRPGRFDRELEIIIPDEDGRHEILKIKTKDMKLAPDVDLFQIARDTHGYVGADIQQLTLEAALQCIRSNLVHMDIESAEPIPSEILELLEVTNDHMIHALSTCDPSTLRDNKVEVPNIKWADIGGLEETKRELQEMVRYPIEHRHLFERFGMQASRGVLFYGPPG